MRGRLARFAYALAFALVAIYAVVTLTGPKGVAALFEKERQIQASEKRNADLEKDIERTKQRIARIGSQTEQERLVEERLNMVRPGDKVFMLPDSKKK